MASLLEWGGQSVIHPCYTITPFPCQLTIDPCYTITPFPLPIDHRSMLHCYSPWVLSEGTPHLKNRGPNSTLGQVVWKTWGVYLTANLGTSSENMNSYLMSMCTSSCSLHLTTTGRVYLTPYLNSSSENINSFPHFGFGSQCAHHLSTSSETVRGISGQLIWTLHLKISTHFLILGLGLSVHFIWALYLKLGDYNWQLIWTLHLKYGLIFLSWVWVSVCTSSGHFIWKWGVYLNLNT